MPTIVLWRSLVKGNSKLRQWNTSITPLIQYYPGVIAGKSARQQASHRNDLDIQLRGACLKSQEEIEILCLNVNKILTYTGHVRNIGKKITPGRQWVWSTLQVPVEACHGVLVSCVVVMSPIVLLSFLDKNRNWFRRKSDQPTTLKLLQQLRDVPGLCVMYKAHKQRFIHLESLLLPRALQC